MVTYLFFGPIPTLSVSSVPTIWFILFCSGVWIALVQVLMCVAHLAMVYQALMEPSAVPSHAELVGNRNVVDNQGAPINAVSKMSRLQASPAQLIQHHV